MMDHMCKVRNILMLYTMNTDLNIQENMSKKECEDLVLQEAVTQAIKRDGSNSRFCRMTIITKDGVERLNNKLPIKY